MSGWIRAGLLTACLTAGLHAQELLYTVTGNAPRDGFGVAGVALDDVDGDGHADLAVSAVAAGYVQVLSGRDGRVLQTLRGPAGYGRRLEAADVDGDGRLDLVIGTPGRDGQQEARVYETREGRLLRVLPGSLARSHFGTGIGGDSSGLVNLGVLGDLDGDGQADHGVGVPGNGEIGDNIGHARLFSSATGGLIRELDAAAPGDGFGWSLASAGDVDGDGRDDVIVGAPGDDSVGEDAGAAHVYSGRTGDMLFTVFGQASDERLGTAVGSLGDVDGDGRADIFVTGRDGSVGDGLVRVFRSPPVEAAAQPADAEVGGS